jgi:hypothetical protein
MLNVADGKVTRWSIERGEELLCGLDHADDNVCSFSCLEILVVCIYFQLATCVRRRHDCVMLIKPHVYAIIPDPHPTSPASLPPIHSIPSPLLIQLCINRPVLFFPSFLFFLVSTVPGPILFRSELEDLCRSRCVLGSGSTIKHTGGGSSACQPR